MLSVTFAEVNFSHTRNTRTDDIENKKILMKPIRIFLYLIRHCEPACPVKHG